MSTVGAEPRHHPVSWEEFLDLDSDLRRDLEIVEGYVFPRGRRAREHQKVARRLSAALEAAAVERMRDSGRAECYETNTEVDVLLWEHPATARKPDAVLHRCLPDFEQLAAEHVVVAVEVLSTWSQRRDRLHKMAEYAAAGIPHYWLVEVDTLGAVSVERYALFGGIAPYRHIDTTHRDMGGPAIHATDPFPIEALWRSLEVAPPE
ncbi:Uma2 family endonuclease [Spiractinospora alimapuensis]|uniref:Uma2 family endonuclease n=1 Tax=Spiractinospora alimapuensis TaxID=2820884 RepID=UPI001F244F06|nr:Uma2 family endonuclease [Spiractinospora alimapuensis]QVQ52634.1 Uma2 family endonuclease [Spiractinospora alimapuensis]